MRDVYVGVIGLGNVGSGTLAILAANADQIALKLGFRLRVAAVCSRSIQSTPLKTIPEDALRTADWREVVRANSGADLDAIERDLQRVMRNRAP